MPSLHSMIEEELAASLAYRKLAAQTSEAQRRAFLKMAKKSGDVVKMGYTTNATYGM